MSCHSDPLGRKDGHSRGLLAALATCPATPCAADRCCIAGVCQCSDGQADCDGLQATGCETLTTTTANCGRCGNKCPDSAQTCKTGTCTCPDGKMYDLTSDPNHCGKCSVSCKDGRVCRSGVCMCPDGFQNCDGLQSSGCIDITS
ncbi:hypothetical protein ABPG75_001593 [Micractinium tetrahymenae]